MKDVKRFDYVCGQTDLSGHSYYGMVERPEGKFVLAETYDTLAAELQAIKLGQQGEVIAEHNGCGRGIQVDNIIVRLCPGDKVVMIRGPIGRVLCSAAPQEDKSHD